jgi:hypothetical protein
MYALSVDQSRTVATTLRSTPRGRCGCACGSSPFATRSVQSARYFGGTPPSWFIADASI